MTDDRIPEDELEETPEEEVGEEAEEEETETPEEEKPTGADQPDDEIVEWLKSLDEDDREELLKGGLKKFHARLNAKSRELAEKMRQLETPKESPKEQPQEESPDDLPPLDPKAQKVLDAWLESRLGPFISQQQAREKEEADSIWTEFVEAHNDVAADLIAQSYYDLGFDKTVGSPSEYKTALLKAYKLARAERLEDLVAEGVEEKVSEIREDGKPVKVRRRRTPVEEKPKTIEDVIEGAQSFSELTDALLEASKDEDIG